MFVNKNAHLIAMHRVLRAKSVELATLREQLQETRKEAGQLRAQQRASQKLISAMEDLHILEAKRAFSARRRSSQEADMS